jgi:hypothetical protein
MRHRSVHVEHGATTTLNLRQSGHAVKISLARALIIPSPAS